MTIYNPSLLDKRRLLAISKSDIIDDTERNALKKTLPDNIPYLFISAVTQEGIEQLKDDIWNMIHSQVPVE